MLQIDLTSREASMLRSLVDEVLAAGDTSLSLPLMARLGVCARRLPERLQAQIEAFRVSEEHGFAMLRGLPVTDDDVGPTPAEWRVAGGGSIQYADMLALLLASLLGDVFGWRTEQNGALVQNIVPVRTDESSQVNSGSKEEIWWHTEDAYLPYPADYLALLCVRNAEQAATNFCHVATPDLSPTLLTKLRETEFVFWPDLSHDLQEGARSARHAILTGQNERPNVRIDPFFMDRPSDAGSAAALDAFRAWVDERLVDVVLEQGDCVLIDNLRTVHGRRAFEARYGPGGRWLKRVSVIRNLRRADVVRTGEGGRVLL